MINETLRIGHAGEIIFFINKEVLKDYPENSLIANHATSMLFSVLTCLVSLRDSDELYDPIKLKKEFKEDYDAGIYKLPRDIDTGEKDGSGVYQPALTLELIYKFLDLDSMRMLYFRMSDRNRKIENEKDAAAKMCNIERLESYLSSIFVSPKEDARNISLDVGAIKGHYRSYLVYVSHEPFRSMYISDILRNKKAGEVVFGLHLFVKKDEDCAIWEEKARRMMEGLITCLVPLRDADELYDPIRLEDDFRDDYNLGIYKDPKEMNSSKDNKPVWVSELTLETIYPFLDIYSLRDLYFRMVDRNSQIESGENSGRGSKTLVDLSYLASYLNSLSPSIIENGRNGEIEEGCQLFHGNSITIYTYYGPFREIYMKHISEQSY